MGRNLPIRSPLVPLLAPRIIPSMSAQLMHRFLLGLVRFSTRAPRARRHQRSSTPCTSTLVYRKNRFQRPPSKRQ